MHMQTFHLQIGNIVEYSPGLFMYTFLLDKMTVHLKEWFVSCVHKCCLSSQLQIKHLFYPTCTDTFLISICRLWVLIRSASTHRFKWNNKKNILLISPLIKSYVSYYANNAGSDQPVLHQSGWCLYLLSEGGLFKQNYMPWSPCMCQSSR